MKKRNRLSRADWTVVLVGVAIIIIFLYFTGTDIPMDYWFWR